MTAGRSRAIQVAVPIDGQPIERIRPILSAREIVQDLECLRLRRWRG